MKTYKFAVIVFISFLYLLICIVSSTVEASENLGEFCWNVVWEDRPNYLMKLLVTSMGNGYFIVQGDSEIQGGVSAWFGSVRLVGNQFRISVHETHSNSKPFPTMDAENSGCQWFLDSTTLNGTGWCSTASYDVEFQQGKFKYSTGTITHILCP